MSEFTIILPHKRNLGNDAALRIALSCLVDNTESEYSLIMDTADDSPLYSRVNAMVKQATTDCIVYWSSDIFAAPGWDVPMLEMWDVDPYYSIVTNVLVECGAMGAHENNIVKDFGKTPELFRRKEFEDWSNAAPFDDNEGWFAPYMISRTEFLDLGGLATNLPGDHQDFQPADQLLFEQWKGMGRRIIRARSYAYHLQRYSEPVEQEGRL